MFIGRLRCLVMTGRREMSPCHNKEKEGRYFLMDCDDFGAAHVVRMILTVICFVSWPSGTEKIWSSLRSRRYWPAYAAFAITTSAWPASLSIGELLIRLDVSSSAKKLIFTFHRSRRSSQSTGVSTPQPKNLTPGGEFQKSKQTTITITFTSAFCFFAACFSWLLPFL